MTAEEIQLETIRNKQRKGGNKMQGEGES